MRCGSIAVCKVGVDTPSADWNFYCGRTRENTPAGMIFADLGNPYRIDPERSRGMAVEAFKGEYLANVSHRAKVWREAVAWMEATARAGASIRLFCHCHEFGKSSPRCHCDVLQHQAILKLIFP